MMRRVSIESFQYIVVVAALLISPIPIININNVFFGFHELVKEQSKFAHQLEKTKHEAAMNAKKHIGEAH